LPTNRARRAKNESRGRGGGQNDFVLAPAPAFLTMHILSPPLWGGEQVQGEGGVRVAPAEKT
jgi:hypothetical protein